MEPTAEQIERAARLHAGMLELLKLDTLNYNRQDHIEQARELLRLRDSGVALAVEVVGDELELSENYLVQTVASSIDLHLRIAELMSAIR